MPLCNLVTVFAETKSVTKSRLHCTAKINDMLCHGVRMHRFQTLYSQWDHPFKTSACLRGEGCPHVPMVQRSQYIRIKNPLHKHFAGMPIVGG